MPKRTKEYILIAALCLSGSMLFFVMKVWSYPPPKHFSDLYPSWYGARELFLHHRNPYSPAVTSEIQVWVYGHPIDSSVSQHQDQNRFVYPPYLLFLLWPFVNLPFEQVQAFIRVFLSILGLGMILLWAKAIRWRPDWAWSLVICLLGLSNFPMLESIYLAQPGMFSAAFLAGSCAALVSGRMVLSGSLLACSTLKPQLSILMVLWFMFWSFAEWHRRKALMLSFGITLLALVAASEFFVRGWLSQFLQAMTAYHRYNNTSSILTLALGRQVGTAFAAVLLGLLASMAWRARHELPGSEQFSLVFCASLACTVVIIPTMYPTTQVVLLPVIFLAVKLASRIFAEGPFLRLVFVALLCLLAWAWITSGVLFILHLTWLIERLRSSWMIVLAPIPIIPVTSLFLLFLYGNRSIPAATPSKAKQRHIF